MYQSSLAVCTRTKDNTVIFQNGAAELLCGKKKDEICSTCFSGHSSKKLFSKDFITLHDTLYEGVHCYDSPKTHTVFLQKYHSFKAIRRYLSHFQLTSQELKVAQCILIGRSNQDILNELVISKSTLKTHLNHLYSKIPFLKTKRKECARD